LWSRAFEGVTTMSIVGKNVPHKNQKIIIEIEGLA
jgi:hypothetical protein